MSEAARSQTLLSLSLLRVLRRAPWLFAAIFFAVFGGGLAQAGSSPTLDCSPAFRSTQSLWAAADFDGDKTVDLARVRFRKSGGVVVTSGVDLFAFCKGSLPQISGSFPQGGLIFSARDIDADHDQDLILWEPFGEKAIGIWLNDGKGGFSEIEPFHFPGVGDDLPHVQRPASYSRFVVASSSKNFVRFVLGGDPSSLTPGAPGYCANTPAHVAFGGRGLVDSRGPPSISC